MNLKGVLEGILFVVGDDGVSFNDLKNILELSEEELNDLISSLKDDYLEGTRGLSIEFFGEKYKLVTKKEHKGYYEKLVMIEKRDGLSQAALETLAIIAYNEPVTRGYIEDIRGVDSSHMVRKLLFRNMVKEVGKADLPGKPTLYSTTSELLDYLGLASIKDLPKIEAVKTVEDTETDLYESKYKD